MDKKTVITILKEKKPYIQHKFHVKKIALFGSYAKNCANTNSDIDIVVEMESDFENFFDLKYYLEELFHKKIDLVKKKNLRPFIKKKIENEIIYV